MLIRMLIKTLALAATLAILSTPALAHAVLLTSQPQDGAVLPVTPQAIQLTFNEPVKVIRLQLVRSDGTVIEATQTSDMMQKVDWAVPETLADGGWLLSYAVISSDTHPVSGTLRLVVGEGDPTFAEAPDESTGYTQYPRLIMLVGVLAGVGLLFAAALFRPLATRRAKAALVAAFVAATVGSAWFIYATAQEAGGGAAASDAALAILGPGAVVFEIGLLVGVALTFLGRRRLAAYAALPPLPAGSDRTCRRGAP